MSTAHDSPQTSPTDLLAASVYPGKYVAVSDPKVPRLENGDRLTRQEFERRYDAMPNLKKAELIEGVVYIASPVSIHGHAQPHAYLVGWLVYYISKTPGVIIADNGSYRLDQDNMPQPDVMLLIPPACGGVGQVDEDDYATGAAELVCEVAASSVSIDLNAKLNSYRRNGVREYLVFRTQDQAIDWFDLVGGMYVPKQADEQGRLRSNVFPGLWLEPAALAAGELPKLIAAVDQGVATEEHREFVKRLEGKG